MADSTQENNGGKRPPEQAPQRARSLVPVTVRGGAMEPRSLPEALELAKLIAHSGMVPKQYDGNVGGVLIAMQMGAEIGLSPMAAIQNIAVINGRPSIWGDAMLALVQSNPDCEDIVEEFDDRAMRAVCTVKRKGRTPTVRSFSVEDAKQAGLQGKQGPWSQYPKRMLAMRARGFALRDAFPDALRGIISAEEAGDIVDMRAEFRDTRDAGEPIEGVHTFGGRRQPAPTEPTHNPDTGEVVAHAPAVTTAAASPAPAASSAAAKPEAAAANKPEDQKAGF